MKGRTTPHHFFQCNTWADVPFDVVDHMRRNCPHHFLDRLIDAIPVSVERILYPCHRHRSRKHDGANMGENAS